LTERSRWLVTCSCGWGREASSEWAVNAVSRLHQQLAEVGTEHVTHVEGPDPHQAGEQLTLDQSVDWPDERR
jgi:hypothetical protein